MARAGPEDEPVARSNAATQLIGTGLHRLIAAAGLKRLSEVFASSPCAHGRREARPSVRVDGRHKRVALDGDMPPDIRRFVHQVAAYGIEP